jgi:hypothetical protein
MGSALRWSHLQANRLQLEGYGYEVARTCQSLFFQFASTGNQGCLELANRLLASDH